MAVDRAGDPQQLRGAPRRSRARARTKAVQGAPQPAHGEQGAAALTLSSSSQVMTLEKGTSALNTRRQCMSCTSR